jgi:hypothetical protein
MQSEEVASLVGQTALIESGPVEATGKVTSADGGSLTIQCDQAVPAEAAGGEALVSVFAAEALYRIKGPVTVAGSELRTSTAAGVERVQRRKWPRRRLDLAAVLCPVADGRRVEGVPGRTVDIGLGGVCVETLRPVEGEGDPMVILSLPDGTSLVAGTTTVAAEDLGDGWRYRLAFSELDAHDAARLNEVIA